MIGKWIDRKLHIRTEAAEFIAQRGAFVNRHYWVSRAMEGPDWQMLQLGWVLGHASEIAANRSG